MIVRQMHHMNGLHISCLIYLTAVSSFYYLKSLWYCPCKLQVVALVTANVEPTQTLVQWYWELFSRKPSGRDL